MSQQSSFMALVQLDFCCDIASAGSIEIMS